MSPTYGASLKAGLILCLAWPGFAAAQAAMVKSTKGQAFVERGAATATATSTATSVAPIREAARTGQTVEARDRIVTGADGSVGLTLADGTTLTAGPNTTLDLNRFSFDRQRGQGEIDASVKRGTLAVVSGTIAQKSPGQVVFRTNSVTLGVRGTAFLIDAGDDAGAAPLPANNPSQGGR